MLNITPDDFISLLNEVWVSVKADGLSTPGNINAQCEDLAQLWARVIGSPRFTGSTADLIYNEPGELYTQVPNDGHLVFRKGDLVIWKWPHVGVATGNGNEVLEQNDPTGSEVHLKVYSTLDGVIGVLRPKQLPTASALPENYDTIIQKSSQWDETCNQLGLGDPNTTLYPKLASVIAGYKSIPTGLKNNADQLAQDLAVANQELANKDTEISTLESQATENQKLQKAQIDKLTENVLSEQMLGDKYVTTINNQQGTIRVQNDTIAELKREIAALKSPVAQVSFWQTVIEFFTKPLNKEVNH